MSEVKLSPADQGVYDVICQSDVMCRQLTPGESEAVPGLIEVYNRDVSPYRVKKIKYLHKK